MAAGTRQDVSPHGLLIRLEELEGFIHPIYTIPTFHVLPNWNTTYDCYCSVILFNFPYADTNKQHLSGSKWDKGPLGPFGQSLIALCIKVGGNLVAAY